LVIQTQLKNNFPHIIAYKLENNLPDFEENIRDYFERYHYIREVSKVVWIAFENILSTISNPP